MKVKKGRIVGIEKWIGVEERIDRIKR